MEVLESNRILAGGICLLLAMLCSACGPDPEMLARMRFEQLATAMETKTTDNQHNAGDKQAQIPIYTEIISTNQENYQVLETIWQQTSAGSVSLYNSRAFANAGFRVGVIAGSPSPMVKEAKDKMKLYEGSDMIILLEPGTSGYMPIGRSINQSAFTYEGSVYSAQIHDFGQAVRYLRLSAQRTSDNKLRLEIVPAFDHLLQKDSGLDMNQLAVNVTLEPKQSVILGETGIPKSPSSALLTHNGSYNLLRSVIVITPVQ